MWNSGQADRQTLPSTLLLTVKSAPFWILMKKNISEFGQIYLSIQQHCPSTTSNACNDNDNIECTSLYHYNWPNIVYDSCWQWSGWQWWWPPHLGSTLRAIAVAPKVFPPTTLPDCPPSNGRNPEIFDTGTINSDNRISDFTLTFYIDRPVPALSNPFQPLILNNMVNNNPDLTSSTDRERYDQS